MHTSSRLFITAAVAGAAVLLPLTAAAPAFADDVPTTATMTISPDALSVATGQAAVLKLSLDEVAGGDPIGLVGHIEVDVTSGGKTTPHTVDVHSAHTSDTITLDTSNPGQQSVDATFVPDSGNVDDVSATAKVDVLAQATLAAMNTVHAGGLLGVFIHEPNGSDGAGGRVTATSKGLTLGSCTPAPVVTTSADCGILIPKSATSGTHSVTLSFTDSPIYGSATLTTAVTVVGGATPGAPTSATGTGTTHTSTGTTTNLGTGAGTPAVSGAQSVSGGSIVTGSSIAGSVADGTTPAQGTTDASNGEPTAVAAPVPAQAGSGVIAATTTASAFSFLPVILIGAAGAGLIGLLLIALVIVLIVRNSKKKRLA